MPRPFKWGILGASTLILSKHIHKNAGKWLFVESPVLPILSISRNPWKAIFQHFYEYLGIELGYRHLVYLILKTLAWEICNMTSEFVKKFKIKSQWQCQVIFIFANIVNFLKSLKSYLPACLWISLDIIIVH